MTLQLSHQSWGRGPVKALMLHGFTGSADGWNHLEPLLGDFFTVTAVDLPGHRGSPLPKAKGAQGYWETVDAVGAMIDEPQVIVGYSLGARIALGVALRFPSKVSRLIVESGTAGIRQRHARQQRRLADAALADQIITQGVDAFVQQWEQLPLFSGVRQLPDEIQTQQRVRRRSHSADGLAGALACLGQGAQPDCWPLLPRARIPALLVCGSGDLKYAAIAQKMSEELPMGWRVSLQNCSHVPHLEQPEIYAAEVRSFVLGRCTEAPVEIV